jgi:hypothetical protein
MKLIKMLAGGVASEEKIIKEFSVKEFLATIEAFMNKRK